MTTFTPSKKFLANIAHKSPAYQARAIRRWQERRADEVAAEFEVAALEAGIDTGTARADLWKAAGKL